MKLTIPTPCHENWDNMNIEEKGRFCSVCSKTVTDFTASSDDEIIEVFSNSPKNSCGNFNELQLNRDLQYSYINSLFVKFTVGFILTTGGFVSTKAQRCEPKEVAVKQRGIKGKVVAPKSIEEDAINEQVVILGGIHREKLDKYKPLYILDGKIIDEKSFRAYDSNLIKDVKVLKGASAMAKYGDKGKNGAIVITTKKKK